MADNTDDHRSSDDLRQEIDQARESMRQTLDALQVKLDPERLKQQAAGAVREATVGRVEDFADNASRTMKGVSTDVFETIKRNPIPAALAAVGIGWLFMESRSDQNGSSRRYYGRSDRYRANFDYDYDYDYSVGQREDIGMRPSRYRPTERARGTASRMQDRAADMADRVQDRASDMANQAQAKAGEVADRVQDKAGEMVDRVQDKAGDVADQVSDWADEAQYRAVQAKSRLQDMFDENPLLIGAAAVALGAAIGLSLPHTPQEDRFLGSARDKMMDKAQDAAKDTMSKVENVAQEAGNAAKDAAKSEAQKQNLTS
jgi:ElaB/YqjD/DUF883 family membrane-anchored ribosome-binding protein